MEKQDLDMHLRKKNIPLVAIWMVTYNHELFIEEAVESVMIQETNFEYKLFIGEDCSTDNTREICKKLKERYPSKVELFLNEKNLGVTKNAKLIFKKCFESGAKYLALIEGDDYWTDPLKLQKQVDLLESNEEFVISCSNCNNVTFDGRFVELFNESEIPEITDVSYILRNKWYIPTATVVFRNNKIDFPNWFSEVLNGDYMLCLLLTSNGGLVHYENEVRTNYRLHDQGVSNIFKKENAFNYSMLYNNKVFNNYSQGKYFSLIKINVEQYSLNILERLPVMSKEFWKVLSNLVWFNKTISSTLLFFLKKRILLKTK